MLSGIRHSLCQLWGAGHSAAGRINIEEHRLNVGPVGGFPNGGGDFLSIDCVEKNLRKEIGIANHRPGHRDHAHAILDGKEGGLAALRQLTGVRQKCLGDR